MRCFQMKMSLRSAGEEDVPYTLLLSACIENITTVYCVLCPSVVRFISWPFTFRSEDYASIATRLMLHNIMHGVGMRGGIATCE